MMRARYISMDANAKLNLGLRILGMRSDGFHDISSVFHSISLSDRIGIHVRPGTGRIYLSVSGDSIPADSRNLAWRAAQAFIDATAEEQDISIDLEKSIPSAAGLGGGSSDAAAVLLGLASLLEFPETELPPLALELGSDVPFFLERGAALVEGRGERVKRISCPPFWAVILHPPISISTPWAYSRWDNTVLSLTEDTRKEHCSGSVRTWHEGEPFPLDLRNDFLPVLCESYPDIADIAGQLNDSFDSWGLSGSGPALYVLFRTEREACEFSVNQPAGVRSFVSRSTSCDGA